MLHGGSWQGRQLLTSDAVRLVTADAGTPGHRAMGWWSNAEGVDPRLPHDAYWGSGAGHQILLVIPSLDLVVVRNGDRIAESGNDPAAFRAFSTGA
jgi:CubicO group peptidase (beta-lactamase class C family)